jgi:MFS superfamily sulfate permease-like transporter
MPLDPRRTRVDYVTGEKMGITPRPAAHAARPPRRYPSPLGVGLMTGGAALVILGSFMPWVRLGPISVSGIEGDGRITLVVGGLTLILALASRTSPSRVPRLLVTLGAVIAVVVAAIDNARLREGIPDDLIGAGVGVVFLGGMLALIGSFLRDR